MNEIDKADIERRLQALEKWAHEQPRAAQAPNVSEYINQASAALREPAPATEGAIPETIYKAVERVMDEHSAWIARPNADVTKAVALAAGIAWNLHNPPDQAPRIVELERERDDLKSALELWKGKVDGAFKRRDAAESALADLRGKVGAIRDDVTAFQIRQPMIALHDDFVINIRDRLSSALLTEGTADAPCPACDGTGDFQGGRASITKLPCKVCGGTGKRKAADEEETREPDV